MFGYIDSLGDLEFIFNFCFYNNHSLRAEYLFRKWTEGGKDK